MRLRWLTVLGAIGLAATSLATAADSFAVGVLSCAAETDRDRRLECYDRAVAGYTAALAGAKRDSVAGAAPSGASSPGVAPGRSTPAVSGSAPAANGAAALGGSTPAVAANGSTAVAGSAPTVAANGAATVGGSTAAAAANGSTAVAGSAPTVAANGAATVGGSTAAAAANGSTAVGGSAPAVAANGATAAGGPGAAVPRHVAARIASVEHFPDYVVVHLDNQQAWKQVSDSPGAPVLRNGDPVTVDRQMGSYWLAGPKGEAVQVRLEAPKP